MAADEGNWKIRRVLHPHDLTRDRILLPMWMVREFVLIHLDQEIVRAIDSGAGYEVTVMDVDDNTQHQLSLVKKNGSYVLRGGAWRQNFVDRKQLKEDDVLGLNWDARLSVFTLTLLTKENQANEPEEVVLISSDSDDNQIDTELRLNPPGQ
ncbi:hypothetical protein BVC80_7837g7 [Macleaya cordata]|uniref:B3 DNA binding domain n=1 Tax=Macleaya cordata TaxID=56857 RepID=A0A200Q8B7_MACCD|nr:hypothetical protein BVC80_7837g7 [Macleaya cordata]